MNDVSVFLLLPESQPSNQWMIQENARSPEILDEFILDLGNKIDVIKIEEYKGYYDIDNINNFLQDYNFLEDYYPHPAKTLLQTFLNVEAFYNWRESIKQKATNSYCVFDQQIENHTFCEIAQRKLNRQEDRFLLLNHAAHTLRDSFEVCINNHYVFVDSCIEAIEIRNWFAVNRQPVRNFHVIEKHGENRHEERLVNGKLVSPLRCSEQKARDLLQTAIGDTIAELFNDDKEIGYYIIFKREGNNPQNMYHGYHVAYTSNEAPKHITKKLSQ